MSREGLSIWEQRAWEQIDLLGEAADLLVVWMENGTPAPFDLSTIVAWLRGEANRCVRRESSDDPGVAISTPHFQALATARAIVRRTS